MKHKDNITIHSYEYFYPLPYKKWFTSRKMKFNTSNTVAVHLSNISWGAWLTNGCDYLLYIYRKLKK